MEESTFRPDLPSLFGSTTSSDVTTIIPRLIQDLESNNTNLHTPSLRQLLEIMMHGTITFFYSEIILFYLQDHGSKDLSLKYNLMPLLNKFAGNIEKNEEFSRDGKTSKSRSKALCELIEENEIIRHSLMTTGFIQKVQYAFINSSQSSSSSSSSQTESTTPYHVKCGLLDILLRLVTGSDDLQPTSILIPILTELKNNGEKEIKNKSINILGIQNTKGINAISFDFKEKDDEIKQLKEAMERKEEELRRNEEELRRKEEELRRNKEELQMERRRADEAQQ
ncbi:MAG: hypothetical protein EZS28_004991 [Streblomastix strix]|uniref:Uncharacterized protein n=1 Tax=Streblomastix strix TaxID=222440 RepID=A0A5J4WX69_9EUKA|nr:MAG: hypothetical protein EZS28_004991 [Streblomastix strix]